MVDDGVEDAADRNRQRIRARFGIVEGMDSEAAKAQVRSQVASGVAKPCNQEIHLLCHSMGNYVLRSDGLDQILLGLGWRWDF